MAVNETRTFFIGERSPDIEVEGSDHGVSLSVGTEWFNLSVDEAVKLAQALLGAAVRQDRDSTWNAVMGL